MKGYQTHLQLNIFETWINIWIMEDGDLLIPSVFVEAFDKHISKKEVYGGI